MELSARAYRGGDLPRLQRALAEWIERDGPCGYCHVGEVVHRIVDELAPRGDPTELVRVWEDGDTIAGFAIEHRFDGSFEVFASPEARGTDAEVEMLRVAADSEAARCDAETIIDVWVGDDRRVAALQRLGFERYRAWDEIRRRPLGSAPTAPTVPPKFAVGVEPNPASAFAAARVVARTRAGELAASAGVWCDPRNRVGCFEPLLTLDGYRRRGLARAVMVEGLHWMHAQGMTAATVEQDATNEPAALLYESLGFDVQFETEGFRARRRARSTRHGTSP